MMQNKGLFGRKPVALDIRESRIGAPGPNEAIVKVHACGVCGTDVNFLKQQEADPVPLGHEIAAEVMDVGGEVTGLAPGDRVIVEDSAMCGTCARCKSGHPELCVNAFDLNGQPGMGLYLRVRCNNLVRFEGLDEVSACLTEPLAVSLNAVLKADIPPLGSLAILGCGPLGLMAARVARQLGAGYIAMMDVNTQSPRKQARTALALRWGADRVIDCAREDVAAAIREDCPDGVDRVIVSAPPESLHDAVRVVGYGGIIVFFGLHFGGRNRVELDVNNLIFRKTTLLPVFAEPAIHFHMSLDLLKRGVVPAHELVTHRFGFDNAADVLGAIVAGDQPVIKAVMLPHERPSPC